MVIHRISIGRLGVQTHTGAAFLKRRHGGCSCPRCNTAGLHFFVGTKKGMVSDAPGRQRRSPSSRHQRPPCHRRWRWRWFKLPGQPLAMLETRIPLRRLLLALGELKLRNPNGVLPVTGRVRSGLAGRARDAGGCRDARLHGGSLAPSHGPQGPPRSSPPRLCPRHRRPDLRERVAVPAGARVGRPKWTSRSFPTCSRATFRGRHPGLAIASVA